MTDVLFLIGTVVAFGVFVLLLRGCERIVGSGQLTVDAVAVGPDQSESDQADSDQPDPQPLGTEMTGATS